MFPRCIRNLRSFSIGEGRGCPTSPPRSALSCGALSIAERTLQPCDGVAEPQDRYLVRVDPRPRLFDRSILSLAQRIAGERASHRRRSVVSLNQKQGVLPMDLATPLLHHPNAVIRLGELFDHQQPLRAAPLRLFHAATPSRFSSHCSNASCRIRTGAHRPEPIRNTRISPDARYLCIVDRDTRKTFAASSIVRRLSITPRQYQSM
jgi:hypothetical protein